MMGEFLKPVSSRRSQLITRERLIAFFVAFLIGCLAFVFLLRRLELAITFHPVRASSDKNLSAEAEDVWFAAADATKLHGLYFASKTKPATATVVYFHGNSGNVSYVTWVARRLATRGFNVLLFDYRGYGQSGGEVGAESGLYADGDAALAYVLENKDATPAKVVLYGESLGTAVAADVASRHSCGAVILESGFSSASSVASRKFPWLPRWLHFLSRNRFESARKLKSVRAPILITHGDSDGIFPTEEAQALFAAANEPKKLLIFPGAGHNVFGSVGDSYLRQVEEFIRKSFNPPQVNVVCSKRREKDTTH
jgi:fermentation-respiration switch protein FrsA (DUF1100 family)